MAELAEDREENDWDREEKVWDDKACLTKEEWKEVFGGKDRKDGYDRDDDRKERGPHRDAFVREMLAELETACDEGNEEACAELEEIITAFEDREGECDEERDDEEDETNEEDESGEDDSNEDDEQDENESDDEDESNEE